MQQRLTVAQMEQLQRWMMAHWAPPPPCAECGETQWNIPNRIETVTLIDAAAIPATQQTTWMVMLGCLHCGSRALLPATAAGLDPR